MFKAVQRESVCMPVIINGAAIHPTPRIPHQPASPCVPHTATAAAIPIASPVYNRPHPNPSMLMQSRR